MSVKTEKELNKNDKDKQIENNKGKSWPQILAILVVTLGPFSNGITFAWSSPYTYAITNDKVNYNITESEASYFIVCQPVGMAFASVFFFQVAELLGRKKSLLFLAVPQVVNWTIIMFAKTKWEFYASRFIAGMSDAVLFCTVPLYVGEISTPTIRGYFGNIPTCVLNAGSFFMQVLGSYCTVKQSAYICIVFPILFFLLVSLLPESPYQLLRDGKFDQARECIRWFRRKPDIEEDFLSMKADVERQMSERAKWKDIYKIDSNRRAMRAALFLRLSQQCCGISVFGSYTQVIFEKAGGSLSPQHSSMIFGLQVLILISICSVAVEKFGRKTTYFASVLGAGIVLLILSLYFFLDQNQIVNMEKINWFPVVGMTSFLITYSFGLGIVPTLMMGELFSASVKSKSLSILNTIFGITVFLLANLFNFLSSSVGFYAPFLFYGVCSLISSYLTLRWVPETKGKTLEEIQFILKGEPLPRKSKNGDCITNGTDVDISQS